MAAEKEREERIEYEIAERVAKLRDRMRGIIPEEARRHLRASRKEFLLALRSLIDSCIEHLEEAEGQKGKKVTKVEVQ
ncbi:MAG: hypothetical protein M1136_10175 [Chloroflexi bacterium]|nr:hypothetical protein [Chloroflexota bacterium]MCL5075996.1 hypothetical protein [Chloroflexota bacterium]